MLFLVCRSASTSDSRIYRRWKTWKFLILRKYRSAVPFRSAFRNFLLPPNIPWLCCIVLLTFDGHHYDVGLIWPNLIRLFAWNYRYSISDSLHSRPDKNVYKIQLIPLQRRKMDLMMIRMRCSFHTGSLLEIKFVTFSYSLKRINVDIWTVWWMFPVKQ